MTNYFVDYENVHENGLEAVQNIEDEDRVFVFYSEQASRINIDSIAGIARQLVFMKVSNGSENALDYQLVSYLGYLIKKYEEEASYVIVSNDKGYIDVVEFWKKRNVRISSRNVKIAPSVKPAVDSQVHEILVDELIKITGNVREGKLVANICKSAKTKEEFKKSLKAKYPKTNKYNRICSFAVQYMTDNGYPCVSEHKSR